ncbi:MAG: family 10 glycosylhydrolase [Bacteroidales bacterium]|nr:family 10 glycosylhydrolase [Bacteroidales bacterium]
MKRLFAAIAATLALATTTLNAQVDQLTPKREFRGAWLHIVGNTTMRNMTTQQIQDWFTSTLDTLQAAGCNAIVFQVRPQADAFFESSLEPWTRFLTGTQGKAPKPYWDPLAFVIEESHKRGMELHAWLNPYRVTSNDKEVLTKDHLYYKNPGIFKRYGKQLYFDPGEPAAREHTIKVIADIVKRYDVDAIHFDDYFYPYPEGNKDFPDDASFKKYGAKDGFTPDQKNDWRRHNTEVLIRDINKAIKEIKPWVRFGISPFGIHRNLKDDPSGSRTNGLSNYDQLFADVPGWANKGYIDYMAPQLYWEIGHPRADYDVLINWWNDSNFKGHLYIGQSISSLNKPDLQDSTTTQLGTKMRMVRERDGVHGNIWWPGWSIPKNVNGICDSLTVKYQKALSLIPAYTDIDAIAPDPVSIIGSDLEEIIWYAQRTDDVMQEPHFYVVYRFDENEDIDISDPKHIVAITKENGYRPAEGTNRYRYVVTVVDHCWNESAPSEPMRLKSPMDMSPLPVPEVQQSFLSSLVL